MAINIKIGAGMAALLCGAMLTPARAQDSLPGPSVAAPAAQATELATPVVKPKPKKLVKRKSAPKPDANIAAAPPAALPPVVVQEPAPQPQNGFYDQLPKQYLLNKMFSPASTGQAGGSESHGAPGAPAPEEETLPNGMPRKFLLNRLFDSSSLEPSLKSPSSGQPDPRSFMAQAAPAQPAQQPSWFEQATGALGFGAKPQDQPTTNLPPVNVTAPANRPAAPAAPPRNPAASRPLAPSPAPVAVTPPQPSWLESIPGFGGGAETIPDYSERRKLAVPPNRNALPAPNPVEERKVSRPPANAEALTRPPAGYTEKVQGPDGKVSGMTEQDEGKKGWFNWF